MGHVQLLLGKPRSGKTARCLAAYAAARKSSPLTNSSGSTLWLTPAQESRQAVLQRLIELTDGVLFQPNVFTFDQFAERVLLETGQGDRGLPAFARRLILRALIHEAAANKQLQHFESIAETEGFLDVVSNFIAELKRAEIWPHEFEAACSENLREVSRRDRELNFLYERYQQILLERNWYDAEGRFWLARTAMKDQPGFWRELSLVVVDGFSDFTRTQQEMLQHLAATSPTVIITLPLEQPVVRRELFAKPEHVLGQLRKNFDSIEIISTDAEMKVDTSLPAGLTQIRDRLFQNPRTLQRLSKADGCQIVAAIGDAGEKSAIALRIKKLLLRGVPPRDIVVGMRSVAVSGPAWAVALSEAGLPVWCEAPPPWSRSPYLKALFAVLQLQLEDWPFERLKGVLTSTLFRPPLQNWNSLDGPQRVTGVLRKAGLHSRRELILRSIERRLERFAGHDPDQQQADYRFALQTLKHLSDALDLLSHRVSLTEWADRLAAVTSRLGLAVEETDRRDADHLQRLLRSAAMVEAELTDPPPKRSLTDFFEILHDLTQTAAPDVGREPPGCVRIVGAETLRHHEPEFVFLVELTEDSFPSRRAEDCLYSEAERLHLYAAGLSLAHRELHQREEMLLFYQAVTRAKRQLTLSYSQVDEHGHAVFPSPYVTAVEDLFEPIANVSVRDNGRLDPIPSEDRILTAADLRLAAVLRARRNEPGWWRLLLDNDSTKATARNVLAAADVAVHRFHAPGFTAYEGRLSNPATIAELAQRFGQQRQFSATDLEAYAGCPFRFWMRTVLELEPLPSPEGGTDAMGRGSLIHQVLAKLAEENLRDAEAVSQRFRELVAAQLDRAVSDSELQQALAAVEKQTLERWADAFADQHVDYHVHVEKQRLIVSQSLFEVPFGAARHAEDSEERFPALELGAGETMIRLGGRIDRIDVAELDGQTVYTVIDYKTGKKPRFKWEDVSAGVSLQLALYTLAVARLEMAGPDAVPHQMGYWAVKETGFTACGGEKTNGPLDQAVKQSLEMLLSETVLRLVSGIRAGVFVVDSLQKDCTGHCPYHTVCRVNQVRSLSERLEKRRPDSLIAPKAGS